MSEETLYQTLLLNRFKSRIFEIVERQMLIPYHSKLLESGDLKAREDFRFIQKCYRRALGLSMAEIRRYIELVDVDELKGFSVELITRPFDIEEYEESTDCHSDDGGDDNASPQRPESPAPPIEEAPQSQAELMDLYDQDIMTRFGFKSIQELQRYLDENVSTYSSSNSAAPVGAPVTQGAQQHEADATEYDENGFFVGDYDGDEDMKDYDGDTDMRDGGEDSDEDEIMRENEQEGDGTIKASHETGPLESNPSPVPRANEVGITIENRSSTPSESSSLQDSDTSFSEPFNFDPSPSLSDSSSDTGRERRSRHLSEELRCLLVKIGGNPNTTRSERVISLSWDEMDVVEEKWDAVVAELKRREDRGLRARHSESWAETNLLDDWDVKHCQFYWQTEGLFLCRLTEVVYKEIFEQARTVFWAERRNARPRRRRRSKDEKPPGTPLRREFT